LRVAATHYEQTDGGATEILIVDSSSSSTRSAIEAHCREAGARYVVGPRNVRMKRNLGVRLARHSVTLFIDSDCAADPDLLSRHARAYRESTDRVDGCVGVVIFEQPPRTLFWKALERTSLTYCFGQARSGGTTIWGPTANTSYRTQILREVGGFDETFPFRLGGDDVDLGLRVTQAGHPLRNEPAAVVWHAPETWGFWAVMRRAVRWGRMSVHLLRKHPTHSLLLFPSTPLLLAGLVALATLAALSLRSLAVFWLPAAWLLTYWACEMLLLIATGRKMRSVARDWLATQVEGVYEFGVLFETLRLGDARGLYRAFSYQADPAPDSGQVTLSERKVIRHWAKVLAFAGPLPIALWL
jgi:GT2 family glycosyltransferase